MAEKRYIKLKPEVLDEYDRVTDPKGMSQQDEQNRIFLEVLIDIRDNLNYLGNIIKDRQTNHRDPYFGGR